MIAGVADTHTAIWYLFDDARLSATSAAYIDAAAECGDGIAISAISLAEIVYLVNKGRVPANVYTAVKAAVGDPEHVFKVAAVTAEIVDAMQNVPRDEVPDMPDRLIAATALYFGVPVISRDGNIRTSNVKSLW